MSAWYDKRTQVEVVNLKLWEQLKVETAIPHSLAVSGLNPLSLPPSQEAVDIFGLSALDRLFCFMIVRELQTFLRFLQKSLLRMPQFLKQLEVVRASLSTPERLIRELNQPNKYRCWNFLITVKRVPYLEPWLRK